MHSLCVKGLLKIIKKGNGMKKIFALAVFACILCANALLTKNLYRAAYNLPLAQREESQVNEVRRGSYNLIAAPRCRSEAGACGCNYENKKRFKPNRKPAVEFKD